MVVVDVAVTDRSQVLCFLNHLNSRLALKAAAGVMRELPALSSAMSLKVQLGSLHNWSREERLQYIIH